VKNLKSSKGYVNKIKKGLIKNPFDNKEGMNSLEVLAESKEKEGFKIVVDFMSYFISKSVRKGYGIFKDEPLVFIESFCMVLDHGADKMNYNLIQTYRGLKVKRLPIGKTQGFFQKIYGSHFFKKG
jgi:hypothetical protein